MKYTRRRKLLHALKFHMLDKATDRVKGPGMTGFTPEQIHQGRMKEAGHNVPIHAGRSRRRVSHVGTLRRRFRGGVIGPNLRTYLALPVDKRAEWFAKRTIYVKEKMAKEYRQLTPEETESVIAQLVDRPEPPPNENPRTYNPTVTQFLPGRAGRRHSTRRGARASRKRPTR
jgi:hypothetical protein